MEASTLEILYRQANTGELPQFDSLNALGIERFYIKRLYYKSDRTSVTRKGHHHTGFEIHIIEHGYQTYEIGGKSVTVNEGELLLISPLVNHIAKSEDAETKKYAITFTASQYCPLTHEKEHISDYFLGTVPSALYDNLNFIKQERSSGQAYSAPIIASRAHECALLLLRLLGISETPSKVTHSNVDERLLLSKQYIRDNILRPVTLPEVASYCCISSKQLTRIFNRWEGTTVTEYVRKQRCLHIEKLLSEQGLSLREISEIMNFSSEYYFNALFKKHSGMSPGAYRKALLNTPNTQ